MRELLKSRSIVAFLITIWIINSVLFISRYLELYLLIDGWEYLTIGILITISNIITFVCFIFGGYIGDKYNKKWLAVICASILSLGYFILGISSNFVPILLGIIVIAISSLFISGQLGYYYTIIPDERSGIAISLIDVYEIFGVIVLLFFGMFIEYIEFTILFRQSCLLIGVIILISAIIRAISFKNIGPGDSDRKFKNIIQDNINVMKKLSIALPGILSIIIIDGISDEIFRFGIYIYLYESILLETSTINIITMVSSFLAVPLSLYVGRQTDISYSKRIIGIIYSVIPISMILIIFPYNIFVYIDSIYFVSIGVIIKMVNDVVWVSLILILFQKTVDTDYISSAISMLVVVSIGSGMIIPLIVGVVFSIMPQITPFIIVFILNIVVLGIIYRMDTL